MKRCLIVKTSSLGDIIHTLPAVTDALKQVKDIEFDWLVEESFQEIPHWHPAVKQVIPVAIRRWRQHIFKTLMSGEWRAFKEQISAQDYDLIIDAQGLIKSALLSRLANGKRYGLDKLSAREPIAASFYHYPQAIKKNQHAVERVRQLFAQVFNYQLPDNIDYGIKNSFNLLKQELLDECNKTNANEPGKDIESDLARSIILFHGTTWSTKHWPEVYWLELIDQLTDDNYRVCLPWGNELEKQRVEQFKARTKNPQKVIILPKLTLSELAQVIKHCLGIVAVDTGLAHLAAALDKSQVSLFGPTNPGLTRPYGHHQIALQVDYECRACLKKSCDKVELDQQQNTIAPACFSSLRPNQVKQQLYSLISDHQSTDGH